jgi:hypothetical protein
VVVYLPVYFLFTSFDGVIKRRKKDDDDDGQEEEKSTPSIFMPVVMS